MASVLPSPIVQGPVRALVQAEVDLLDLELAISWITYRLAQEAPQPESVGGTLALEVLGQLRDQARATMMQLVKKAIAVEVHLSGQLEGESFVTVLPAQAPLQIREEPHQRVYVLHLSIGRILPPEEPPHV